MSSHRYDIWPTADKMRDDLSFLDGISRVSSNVPESSFDTALDISEASMDLSTPLQRVQAALNKIHHTGQWRDAKLPEVYKMRHGALLVEADLDKTALEHLINHQDLFLAASANSMAADSSQSEESAAGAPGVQVEKEAMREWCAAYAMYRGRGMSAQMALGLLGHTVPDLPYDKNAIGKVEAVAPEFLELDPRLTYQGQR